MGGGLAFARSPEEVMFTKGRELARSWSIEGLQKELIRQMNYSWSPHIPTVGAKGTRLQLPRAPGEGRIEDDIRRLIAGYISTKGSEQGQKDVVKALRGALEELDTISRQKIVKLTDKMKAAYEIIKIEVGKERPGLSAREIEEEATRRLNRNLYDRNIVAHGLDVVEYRETSGKWDGSRYAGSYYERMEKRVKEVLSRLEAAERTLDNAGASATEVLGKVARDLGTRISENRGKIVVAAVAAAAVAAAVAALYYVFKEEEKVPVKIVPKKVEW